MSSPRLLANPPPEESGAEPPPKPAKPALLIKADAERVLFFRAGAAQPETVPLNEFTQHFRTDILLVAREATQQIDAEEKIPEVKPQPGQKQFGFRWFIPELLKHKRVWRDILRAEVWVGNQDVGFIHTGAPVKIKFASYQFQKYGMIEGQVAHLSADASDNNNQQQQVGNKAGSKSGFNLPFAYRALIDLKEQFLEEKGVRHNLTPGMQVTAEIHLGTRSILEYLLSPVTGAFHEAARER